MSSTMKQIAAASLCAGLAAAGAAHGQQYPVKPVRVIVPFALAAAATSPRGYSPPSFRNSSASSSWSTTAAARAG